MAGAFQGLAKTDLPHASSATRIMQQVGGAFGAAVLIVILTGQLALHPAAGPAGLAAAYGRTFWWCIGFTILAIVPTLLMPGRPSNSQVQPMGAEAVPAAAGTTSRVSAG